MKQIFLFMSKFNLLSIIVVLFSSLVACNKVESANTDSDNYYVKYIFYKDATRMQIDNITINTEKGEQVLHGSSNFEVVIGPVEKGFEASILVEGSGYRSDYAYIEIYVSVNTEPFALKLQKEGNVGLRVNSGMPGSMSATYIVGE